MKKFRTAFLALVTAGALAIPMSSAEAHKRHNGDAAAAFAFGLFAGTILGHGSTYYPRHRYRHSYSGNCYGMTMSEYEACMNGAYVPRHRVLPHRHYHHRKVYRPHYGKKRLYPGGINIIIGP